MEEVAWLRRAPEKEAQRRRSAGGARALEGPTGKDTLSKEGRGGCAGSIGALQRTCVPWARRRTRAQVASCHAKPPRSAYHWMPHPICVEPPYSAFRSPKTREKSKQRLQPMLRLGTALDRIPKKMSFDGSPLSDATRVSTTTGIVRMKRLIHLTNLRQKGPDALLQLQSLLKTKPAATRHVQDAIHQPDLIAKQISIFATRKTQCAPISYIGMI